MSPLNLIRDGSEGRPLVPDDLLTTWVEQRDGVTVLGVAGDIDMATLPVLETAVADVLADGPVALVIDLSTVPFMASGALGILMMAREKFSSATRFAVVVGGPATRKVIRAVNLDEFLSLQETLEGAVAAVSPQSPDLS